METIKEETGQIRLAADGTQLPVMEAFYTLQGEGACTGQAAYFIRLGGCDVGCHWCDVKESWPMEAHPLQSVQDIVAAAVQYPGRLAVITGGEPAMHPLAALTGALKEAGFKTNMETSGTHPLTGQWDWICFSPKKFKQPLEEYYRQAHELKVVIYNKSDFAWAEQHAAKMHPDAQLFLQPEWDQSEKMLPLIIGYIQDNPKWKMSLQTHKYMQIP